MTARRKLVCISDTHTLHAQVKVPDGDILIHAGDFCGRGSAQETHDFADWFVAQPHKHKVFIAGNHDLLFESMPKTVLGYFDAPNVHYLQDSSVEIEGLKFWGSPWQPEFCNWAFNLQRGYQLRNKWALIPDDIDVLITHGPAQNIRDRIDPNDTRPGSRLGCRDLLDRMEEIRAAHEKLKLHVFGHIHGSYGKSRGRGMWDAVNASICTEAYRPTNAPIVVEL